MYLKQCKMDEKQNELRTTEPEMMVAKLYKRNSLDHCMSLFDLESHPSDDSLQLRSNSQDCLQK